MKGGFTAGALALAFVALVSRRVDAASPEPEPEPEPPPEDVTPPAIEPDDVSERRPPSLLDHPAKRVSLSAFSSLNTGAGVLAATGAYVELQRDAPEDFSPSIRVGFELGWGAINYGGASAPNENQLAGGVNVARSLFRLDLCPLRAIGAARWSNNTANIALCARGDVGTVTSTLTGSTTLRRPWVATGVIAQARWSFTHGFFGIELGITAPIIRDRYFYEPGIHAYETPPATFTFAIGGGVYVL